MRYAQKIRNNMYYKYKEYQFSIQTQVELAVKKHLKVEK